MPEDMQRQAVLSVLADDKTMIPNLLSMLEIERKENSELIADINLQLSRTHIYVEKYSKEKRKGQQVSRDFMLEKVGEFYGKYAGKIRHCFDVSITPPQR